MVIKPGKRKDFYGVCAKICGVPLGTLHRGGNGQYSLVFQRCDASLEDIEGIDWSRPVVTEAADRYRDSPLPEGYGFEVEGIDYLRPSGRIGITRLRPASVFSPPTT